jgi:hypothetical protein
MFIKKNDGSDSIVELGTGGGSAAIYIKTTVTATAGQTTVTGLTYTAGLVDVYLNGARLVVGQDVTATNGTSVVLASGANLNDIIQVVAFKASEAFTPASPTFTGTLTAPIINASTTLQVGGIAVTSTASELNLLDGATTTAAELNILDNATITTAELNILDGVTSTTAELNILDGVTSTAAELNILDGVTATAAELNYVDGVTSNVQTQIDGIVPGMHTLSFTASGAIAAKKPVILNGSAGTVSEVAIADITKTQPSPMRISSNPINAVSDDRSHHAIAWETNGNRFIWANQAGVRVGTVSGTGSNTTVVQGLEAIKLRPDGQGYYTTDIIADPNNSGRFMAMYSYSYEVYYIILTIIGEGSSAKVQLGTKSTNGNNPKISNSPTDYTPNHSLAWDKTSGKVVSVFCTEYDAANRFTANVITVDGTECENTNGITTIHEGGGIEYRRGPALAQDPNTPGLFVVSWRQSASGSTAPHKGVMRSLKLTDGVIAPAGNVTAIPNSDSTIATADGSQHVMSGQNICFDPTTARQLVVLEAGSTEARSWIANVPDASGAFTGDITFQSSTPLDITADRVCIPAIAAMGQTASGEDGKYLISYYTVGTSGSPTGDWYHQIGSLDGTTMTWGTREATGDGCDVQYSGGYPAYGPNHHIASDSTYAGRAVSLIYDNEGSNKIDNPYVVEVGGVYNTTNLSGNFIGVSSEAIADTASGNVVIKGGVTALPASQTFTVTVANSGGNKFVIDGVLQDTLDLYEGYTYKFDQSDSTNSGHPLRLSTTSNGTHNSGSEYTTGVTTNGTPGSSGAYTQIVVAGSVATLYYYCSSHSGMGGTANTPASLTVDSTYYVQSSGAINTTATTGTEIGKAVTTTKLLLKGL